MADRDDTLGAQLARQGVSRRAFLKFCAATASLMALPPSAIPAMAEALARARRPSVIYLPFQECTGCAESLLRSHSPSIEALIFNSISLDYQVTIMAPAGEAAERSLEQAIKENDGKYILMVDGSIPMGDPGYGTHAGHSFTDHLQQAAKGAAAVIAVGTCASFGGLPHANPNPTGAVSVAELMERGVVARKPLINISGCPPIPVVITGVIAQYLTLGTLPELDDLGRPLAFFGDTIHDRCYRRPFYDHGKFAKTFDDEGARNGWCLYELGCKGPVTHNACATTKWNNNTSFPIESGHGCLGCSEPDFWDAGSFYAPLAAPSVGIGTAAEVALAAGVAVGAAAGIAAASKRSKARAAHRRVTVDDFEKGGKP